MSCFLILFFHLGQPTASTRAAPTRAERAKAQRILTATEGESSGEIDDFLPQLVIDPGFPIGPTKYELQIMEHHQLTAAELMKLREFITVSSAEFKLWLRSFRAAAAGQSLQVLPSQFTQLDDIDKSLMSHFGLSWLELLQWASLRQVRLDEFNTWLQRVRSGRPVMRFIQYQDFMKTPAEQQRTPATPLNEAEASSASSVGSLIESFEKLSTSSSSGNSGPAAPNVVQSFHTPQHLLKPRDLFQSQQWMEQSRQSTSLSSIQAPAIPRPSDLTPA